MMLQILIVPTDIIKNSLGVLVIEEYTEQWLAN